MSNPSSGVTTVMQESRKFPPTAEFAAKARIPSLEAYQKLWDEAAKDTEAFWGKLGKEELHWFQPLRRRSNGTSRLPSGLSAARPTRRITVSTNISALGGRTRPRSFGKASRAIPAC